jgi:hypothetical protein
MPFERSPAIVPLIPAGSGVTLKPDLQVDPCQAEG